MKLLQKTKRFAPSSLLYVVELVLVLNIAETLLVLNIAETLLVLNIAETLLAACSAIINQSICDFISSATVNMVQFFCLLLDACIIIWSGENNCDHMI